MGMLMEKSCKCANNWCNLFQQTRSTQFAARSRNENWIKRKEERARIENAIGKRTGKVVANLDLVLWRPTPKPIPIIIPQKKKKGSRQVIKQKATPRTQKEVTFSHRYLAAFYEFWLNEFVTLPCLSGSGYSLCFCWLLQPKLFFFGILCWYCFVDAF